MTSIRTALLLPLCAVGLSFASPRLAVAAVGPDPTGDDEGDQVELGEEPLPPEDDGTAPGGAAENPDAPAEFGSDNSVSDKPNAVTDEGGYPLELARRPLTLLGGMSEALLDLRSTFNPVTASGHLRAGYGVTDEIEVGLRYAAGALTTDEFITGKAVSVGGVYRIEPWIAAQFSVPILLDPFGISVVVGAPVLFRWDGFAVFGGRDLLSVKIKDFIPSTTNSAFNRAQVALSDVGTTTHDAELRLTGGVIYQLDPDLAITAETGVIKFIGASDSQDSSSIPLEFRLTYSISNKFDLGGRAFIGDFDRVTETAGIAVFAALRI